MAALRSSCMLSVKHNKQVGRCSGIVQTVSHTQFSTKGKTSATVTATPIQPSPEPFFDTRRLAPSMQTAIPGPRAQNAARELEQVFDIRSLNMMVDYEESNGNFVVDADGNRLLDCFAQIASIPVGYNNPRLVQAAQSREMIRALVNRPAIGNFPSTEWLQILREGLLRAAPEGFDQVFTGMSGSDANEAAYKAACMWKAQAERGGPSVEFTKEEIESSMNNMAPGSPSYSILSFKGGFHGRLFGSLSTTRSKLLHKLDIPAFDWPGAPFPQLNYPLAQHTRENAEEEARCLEATEKLIQSFHNPVAAVIVEPVQSEGGDNHASPVFFQGLRDITLRHNVTFIVDEVQTGVGATGKMWAHEHWNLTTPPDIVTFSKKAQAAGYYYRDSSYRPNKPYRQFNTWMGDPSKAILFQAILQEIEARDLVGQTARVGSYLYSGLESLAEKYPNEVQNLRGKDRGTFLAFDSPRRDEVVKAMKQRGVNIGGSGERAVRLRPMLIFEESHADILLETLEKVLQS